MFWEDKIYLEPWMKDFMENLMLIYNSYPICRLSSLLFIHSAFYPSCLLSLRFFLQSSHVAMVLSRNLIAIFRNSGVLNAGKNLLIVSNKIRLSSLKKQAKQICLVSPQSVSQWVSQSISQCCPHSPELASMLPDQLTMHWSGRYCTVRW